MNTHIEQRDFAIAHAHGAVSDAIRNLDLATVHAQAIGDYVHVEHLAGITRQLAAAREPLAEHIDFVSQASTGVLGNECPVCGCKRLGWRGPAQ